MAARKPLVLDGANRIAELPSGDTVTGMPLYLRVGLRTSTVVSVPLTSGYALTIGLRAGGTASVQAELT